MNTVFLDTVGLIAVWNSSDQWHIPALRAYEEVVKSNATVVTTRYVLLECGNAASRTSIRQDVVDLQAALAKAGGLIAPTDKDWDEAWQTYSQSNVGAAGIVDQVSFIVMRRLGVARSFTNDRHFAEAGFEMLF